MPTPDWGTMTWLVEDKSHPGAGLSLARMTVHTGLTSPAHRHPDTNEAIHVLSGTISERLNDAWVDAAAGDTVFIPAGTVHQSRCTSAHDAVLMIAYSEGTRIYEEEKT